MHADLTDIDSSARPLDFAQRFAAVIAVNGPAWIAFSAMPAKDARSLTHVLRQAAAERGSSNPSIYFESVGGESHRHPGLTAEVSTGCELALFEDGGTVFIMEALGEADIWADYQPFLRAAMLSVEVLDPLGPTLALSPGGERPQLEEGVRDPDVVAREAREAELKIKSNEARGLIEAGQFDAAEALIIDRDRGPELCALMGRLYEECLRDSAERETEVRESLYRRALNWRLRSYPEPHTQMEADSYRSGMEEDRSRLLDLLGYDPD